MESDTRKMRARLSSREDETQFFIKISGILFDSIIWIKVTKKERQRAVQEKEKLENKSGLR